MLQKQSIRSAGFCGALPQAPLPGRSLSHKASRRLTARKIVVSVVNAADSSKPSTSAAQPPSSSPPKVSLVGKQSYLGERMHRRAATQKPSLIILIGMHDPGHLFLLCWGGAVWRIHTHPHALAHSLTDKQCSIKGWA